MALPFYSRTVDSVGRERTYWTMEALRVSPNGIEVWSTNSTGSLIPFVDLAPDLGSSGNRFGTLYAQTISTTNITPTGIISLANGTAAAPSLTFASDAIKGLYSPGTNGIGVSTNGTLFHVFSTTDFSQRSTGRLTWSNGDPWSGTQDLILVRDAANTLAQRNGTNAQIYRLYNTFTDATTYERGNLGWAANALILSTEKGSVGGTPRDLYIGPDGASLVGLRTNATLRWYVDTNGHFLGNVDNTYDIGASGATRPRSVYVGTSLVAPTVNVTTALQYGGTALQVYQSSALNPTGTTDTAGKMMGLAGAITPRSTRIFVTINGNLANSTINDGGKVEIRYGTGTAPTNAAALTGTVVGNQAILTGDLAANDKNPFACSAIITGLTAGTPYWLDVDLAAITGGTATITEVQISAMDIP